MSSVSLYRIYGFVLDLRKPSAEQLDPLIFVWFYIFLIYHIGFFFILFCFSYCKVLLNGKFRTNGAGLKNVLGPAHFHMRRHPALNEGGRCNIVLFMPHVSPWRPIPSPDDSCPISVPTLRASRLLLSPHPLCHCWGRLKEVMASSLGFLIWWFLA